MNISIPASQELVNLYQSRFSPSTVHCKNTGLVDYYTRYLLQKVISVYQFDGIPDHWDKDFFTYVLFGLGYVAQIVSPMLISAIRCYPVYSLRR